MENSATQLPFLLSPGEAHAAAGNVLLLDVRTPAEFESAHIRGSILHPLTTLDPAVVAESVKNNKGCVVVCQSGTRARQAAAKLQAAGLHPVHVLDGGIQAWASAGLPLERGRQTISLERQVRIAAGSLVVIGAALGYFVHPAWIALSGFVGCGLVFAGITDFCGMGLLLARMPWNQR